MVYNRLTTRKAKQATCQTKSVGFLYLYLPLNCLVFSTKIKDRKKGYYWISPAVTLQQYRAFGQWLIKNDLLKKNTLLLAADVTTVRDLFGEFTKLQTNIKQNETPSKICGHTLVGLVDRVIFSLKRTFAVVKVRISLNGKKCNKKTSGHNLVPEVLAMKIAPKS